MSQRNHSLRSMGNMIFVVGAPRSGTSYLARALGLADDCAYLEETGAFSLFGARRFYFQYMRILRAVDCFRFNPTQQCVLGITDRLRGIDRLTELVHRMLLNTKLEPYNLEPSARLVEVQHCVFTDADERLARELVGKYKTLAKDGISVLFQEFFGDFGQLSGKRHLIEKTPGHTETAPVIRTVFPDAKFILIRREKKDSVASYLRNYDSRQTLGSKLITDRMVLKKQCQLLNYYEQIGTWLKDQEWCHTIEYANLIEEPLETITQALNWAGVAQGARMQRSLLVGRRAESKWNRLNQAEQELVERLLRTS